MQRLRAAGCVFAEDEAALLVAEAADAAALERMVQARESGLPLEQVLGWAEFCGLKVVVAPGVFVPRRRTRLLVREAVRRAGRLGRDRVVVVDLCCGTGAIGLAVATRLARWGIAVELAAADLDPAATACAERNLPQVAGAEVFTGDLYAALPGPLRGHVDLLLANAPYVPTAAIALMPPEARDHEARTALDGGADGLDLQRRIAAEAPDWLAADGAYLVETSRQQAATSRAIVRAVGLRGRVIRDDGLDGTIVLARPAAAR